MKKDNKKKRDKDDIIEKQLKMTEEEVHEVARILYEFNMSDLSKGITDILSKLSIPDIATSFIYILKNQLNHIILSRKSVDIEVTNTVREISSLLNANRNSIADLGEIKIDLGMLYLRKKGSNSNKIYNYIFSRDVVPIMDVDNYLNRILRSTSTPEEMLFPDIENGIIKEIEYLRKSFASDIKKYYWYLHDLEGVIINNTEKFTDPNKFMNTITKWVNYFYGQMDGFANGISEQILYIAAIQKSYAEQVKGFATNKKIVKKIDELYKVLLDFSNDTYIFNYTNSQAMGTIIKNVKTELDGICKKLKK